MNPPFANCSFHTCDLPGQCAHEGACHHPEPIELIYGYQRPDGSVRVDTFTASRVDVRMTLRDEGDKKSTIIAFDKAKLLAAIVKE